MKKQKKVIIFDLDGTLIDSMNAFADIAANVMHRHYNLALRKARKQYLETSGLPFHDQVEKLFPGHKANRLAVHEFETEKKKKYFETKTYSDTLETLRALKQKKLKVVVSSNNFQELADQYLEHVGVQPDLILGWKPNFAKGEPHFTYIEQHLGIKRDEMAFIGDSLHDGERAQEAGIDFIGKVGTFTSADFRRTFPKARVIKTLSELKQVF